jgi:hypothetical protein
MLRIVPNTAPFRLMPDEVWATVDSAGIVRAAGSWRHCARYLVNTNRGRVLPAPAARKEG